MFGRKGKTKQQLAFELKQKQEYERNRKLAREVIWPVVAKHATDAKHAEQTLQIFKTVITQMMQMPYKEMTLGGLKMDEQLTKEEKAPDREFHMELIEALKDIPIVDVMKLIEGMAGSINGYTMGIAGKKPMTDINIDEVIK